MYEVKMKSWNHAMYANLCFCKQTKWLERFQNVLFQIDWEMLENVLFQMDKEILEMRVIYWDDLKGYLRPHMPFVLSPWEQIQLLTAAKQMQMLHKSTNFQR